MQAQVPNAQLAALQQQQALENHYIAAGQRALGGIDYHAGMEPSGVHSPIRSYLIQAGQRHLNGDPLPPLPAWIGQRLGVGGQSPVNALASQGQSGGGANALAVNPQYFSANSLFEGE